MSELIKIDKGIPVPPDDRCNVKYPWDKMEVGDSLIVKHASSAFYANKNYAPKRFITRKTPDGRRVWRVA